MRPIVLLPLRIAFLAYVGVIGIFIVSVFVCVAVLATVLAVIAAVIFGIWEIIAHFIGVKIVEIEGYGPDDDDDENFDYGDGGGDDNDDDGGHWRPGDDERFGLESSPGLTSSIR